ncbi:MAG: hypothetical protein HRU24_13160 [Gammaproteobacteria bacterium]|nr:hypothetical protein [Gammaproteobacteria bacterium]
MKKLAAYVLSLFLILTPITIYSPKSEATGIPTVDIVSFIQSLLEYIQQLSTYAESIYQSSVAANEYVQTLQQMEQIYREYEHALNQIKGLADLVDNDGWKDLLGQIDIDFPLNPLDSSWNEWGVAIYTDDGVIDIDEKVSTIYKRIRNLDDVFDDIDTVFDSSDMRDQQKAQAEQHYLRSREATEQAYAVKAFQSRSENLAEAEKSMAEDRENVAMGDESQLRTLQIMAMQLELQIAMQKSQNDMTLKNFKMSNQDVMDRKAQESFAYDMYLLDKLEIKNSDKYEAEVGRVDSVNF